MYNKINELHLKEQTVKIGVLRIVKLTVFFLVLGMNFCYAAETYSQSKFLTLSIKNKTIKEVFSEIEKNSEFVFFYYEGELDLDKKVSLNIKNQTIDIILSSLFESTNIQYTISDRQIAISKKLAPPPPPPAQQPITVSGVVTDENSEPIPGVNVILKGTSTGVVTNIDGKYSISVPNKESVLVFSFVGHKSVEIQILDKTTVDVVLNEDVQELEDVVVVGYGTQKKASAVGSIAQATSEDLQRAGGVVNLGAALAGQLPGVTVIQSVAEPGNDNPLIYIRGMGTWNNAQPLILVDGIERSMNEVDVNEVESVSVLKDASATAVFGVKGAEGVILVTTKRGKIGKPVFSVDASVSTKAITKLPKKLNSYDQFQVRNDVVEYQLNATESATDWDSYMPYRILQYYKQPQTNGLQYIFPDVDWEDELIKNFPFSYRTNFSVSGGTEFAKYFGSVSYTFDDDILRTDLDPTNRGYKAQNSYERINFRTNLDLNVTKSTVFSVNLAGWVGTKRNNYGSGDVSEVNIFRAFTEASPDQAAMLMPDGSYGYDPQQSGRTNPLQSANNGGVMATRYTNLATDFILKQDLKFLLKGLSARFAFSYDNTFYSQGGIQDGGQSRRLYIDPDVMQILYTVDGSYVDKDGNFYWRDDVYSEALGRNYTLDDFLQGWVQSQSVNHDYDWSKGAPAYEAEKSSDGNRLNRRMFYSAQINYGQTFGRHEIGVLGLFSREQQATGNMFPRYREDWVGRLTYNYAHRYLFESNFAYNGSEQFGPGYRFGFFPSVAAGWMLTEESFMQNINWLPKLKFRYSIGKTGNDRASSERWAYMNRWELDEDRTRFGYPRTSTSPYQQYYESIVGNPDLHWEVSIKQNLGVEIGLFKNKVNLNMDFFLDNRKDILMLGTARTIPEYYGQSAVVANIGKTRVKGYELELSLRNTFGKNLYTYLTMTHTGAFDEILYMEDAPLLPDYQKAAGFPINQITSQLDAGILQNWDDVYSAPGNTNGNVQRTPGEYRIIDYNGDGTIYSDDAAPYSYPQDRPQHTYSFTLGGEYKGFSLMLQFYGIYNVSRVYNWTIFPFGNLLKTGPALEEFVYNAWTPENPDAKYRSMKIQLQGSQSIGTFSIVDGSYLRLKTAEIGYTLRNLKGGFLGINSVKFYLNGVNLFLWTKMVDDREGKTGDSIYPLVRRFNLGMNITF